MRSCRAAALTSERLVRRLECGQVGVGIVVYHLEIDGEILERGHLEVVGAAANARVVPGLPRCGFTWPTRTQPRSGR